MTPLQVPGGPEMFIILFVVLVPLVFVIAAAVGVVILVRAVGDDEEESTAGTAATEEETADRVAALERRGADLEGRVDTLEGGDEATDQSRSS